VSEFSITSPVGKTILEELPNYYDSILEMRVLVQVEGEEFDRLHMDMTEQLQQQFVETATWDLSAWEEEFGVVPIAGQPLDQRRSVVRSKMRGFGKFSGRLLKNVAEAYDNGEVNLSFDPSSSTFTVTFVSSRGIPPNLSDTQKAILEIIPAHLIVAFEFTYLTWNEIEQSHLTWNQLDALSLTWDELETWKP
jgi:hypothetical protein